MSGIRVIKNSKKFYARCGLCDKDFKSKKGMDNHFRSEEHIRRVKRWYELCAVNKDFGSVLANMNGNAKEVLAEEKRSEVVEFT